MPRTTLSLSVLLRPALALLVLLALLALPALAQPADEPVPDDEAASEEDTEAATDDADDAEEADEEEDDWDVSDPPGEGYTVDVDVREGTWMSLDVSPDGTEIVFDLLGDLYTIPIAGGEATALTSGLAWDMQPRYSPDGTTIAFTSDRSGGDNVWLIDRDGTDPRQVTEESYRLLNSPAWSPDGEWIVARKHFTSRRSLGAGELWLYHRSGGGGLQLTEKPNDQKDAGEPAFSPDGRYVYFSQDLTPGDVFEYNKDPNTRIYTLRRFDRETGRVENLVERPGGAVRPTPSPDGRRLAFVGRDRYQTKLFVRDLASGRERAVYGALERDMQETWAVHGVYPGIAWTPDSQALVFWAAGRLHRVDVTDLDAPTMAEEIPFHVTQTHTLFPAVRFPVEVAPDRFDVRMLRWAEVSPAGDRVVYEALGKLWLRDLPDGTPRRLTTQDDHFELYPSWSRDGRRIVYVSWDDEELGAVRLLDVGGRGTAASGRVVTAEPGHYVEPALSPDGATIVFRKVEGGFVTSPLWSGDPGLYRVPAAGGEAVRIAYEGFQPHFGATSDVVYVTVQPEYERRELRAVPLVGTADAEVEPRSLYWSKAATELEVSPDGEWLAFAEGWRVYVTPFVATGKTVEIGPETKAVPLRRVASRAGGFLHWSGDSQRLHWTLGPELFTAELREAFRFVEGAPEELPEPVAEGVVIGFTADYAKPTGTIALVGGQVLTMAGDGDSAAGSVIADGTVVVTGDRIVAVGPRDEVAVPAGAEVVDVTGHTVLPGLIDVHWHGSQGADEIVPEQNWYDYSSLAFGVTTIHDPSNDNTSFFAASELAKAGEIVAPRLFSTGRILYGAEGDFRATIDSLEDARFHLERMKAIGAWSVKSYNQPRRDQRQQVLTAARELEMMVVPEGGSLFQHNMTMVVDGHTGIEHAIPVAHVYDDVLQLWGESEVGYTPTLVVAYGGLWGENYWYGTTDVWANGRLLAYTPRDLVDPIARRPVIAPGEEYNHITVARTTDRLHDAGVPVQLGAHGQREGLGAHWELWMFEQGGMSPLEALRVATYEGAWYLGLDGDLGSLEPGKLADLIVVPGDLLSDLRSSENVRYTMLGGVLYDALTMDRLLPEPAARRPFFFAVE